MKNFFSLLLSLCGSCLLIACAGGNSQPPPPAATHFSVAAQATATAGTAFSLTVTALDASNNVVASYSGTVRFSSSDSQAVLPANSTLTNGTGTFSATLKTAGNQTITATDTVRASITGTSNSTNVITSADHFSVIAPATVTAGMAFNFTVTALDASNNVATSYSGTVHFSSTDAQAVVPPNSGLTNGTGTFAATLNTIVNTIITATDAATTSITGNSSRISVVSNAVTHFLVATPGSATTRASISVEVKALDAANNISIGYSGTVHFTSTDGKAILPADSTLPNGIGNFSATLETAGNQTITVTDRVTASLIGTSNSIGVSAAPALTITSGAPPNGTVGVDYGPSKTEYFLCVFTHVHGPHWVCNPCSPANGSCGAHPSCNGNIFNSPCIEREQVFNGFTFKAAGGVSPYSWSASSLPPGLRVNANGEILGTPTSPNSYNVSVTVTDSGNPAVQTSANYNLMIAPPPRPVVNTTPAPPPGVVKQPYNYTFTASGYPPLTWSESGAVPNGLAFDNSTGVLSGTPTVAQSFPIAVTATDQFNQNSVAASFTIVVSLHGFQATGSMTTARQKHTATLLGDGKVLVAGGEPDETHLLATGELFDPSSGSFAPTGSMQMARIQHTATLLQNGKVLVAGGRTGAQASATATAEIFDPATGTFTPTGSMGTARATTTATLLNNGKVLVTGGAGPSVSALATAEIYDPATGIFTPTGSMGTARNAHTATLLVDGKVLVTGGDDANANHLKTAELFDPAAGTFTAVPGIILVTRAFHTATRLGSGKVLVAGGVDDAGKAQNTAELFDPVSGSFSATVNMITGHAVHTATLLNDGTVLLAGGFDANLSPLRAAELFDPVSGSFASMGSLVTARAQHAATLLSNGKVLVTGGSNAAGALASAELYE